MDNEYYAEKKIMRAEMRWVYTRTPEEGWDKCEIDIDKRSMFYFSMISMR